MSWTKKKKLMLKTEHQFNTWENGEKWAWPGSRDLFFQISGPPNIYGMAEARMLTFCTRIEGKTY